MGFAPFALSIHQFVSPAGAHAGFAAIAGLAILVMLYFAQARETANLREQADEAAQRVGSLEARLAQLARQPAAPPVAGAPASARAARNLIPAPGAMPGAAVPARAPASVSARVAPGPPAGVAAPALAAATRLIPVAIQNGSRRSDGMVDWPAEAVAGGRSPAVASSAGAPAAATFAGTANGSGHDRVSPPPARGGAVSVQDPPTAHAGPRSAQGPPPAHVGPGSAPRPPRVGTRPGATSGARRPLLPPEPPPRRSGILRVLAALLVVAVLGVAVAVLLIATSGSGNSSSNSAPSTSNAPGARQAGAAAAFKPSSVTVVVLNGTYATGLAGRTAARLAATGYKQGKAGNAADQTHSATLVAYLPGYKADATRVAGTLGLRPSSVQAIDAATQAVACPPPAPCTANVVVTVGTDLASH